MTRVRARRLGRVGVVSSAFGGSASSSGNDDFTDKSINHVIYTTLGFLGVVAILVLASMTELPTATNYHSTVFETVEEIPTDLLLRLDAILVLGGGVPTSIDAPPVYVQRRCDDAAQVVQRSRELGSSSTTVQSLSGGSDGDGGTTSRKRFQRHRKRDLPILCLSAGTKHLPQLVSADGLPVWESTACAAYLDKKHHIRHVYVETTSYDTIGNAFFARTSHTDVAGWRNLLIVTNEFHMERTKAIFDWIFTLDSSGYELTFLASPNIGLEVDAVEARRKKEKDSLPHIESLKKRFKSLRDLWSFLNEEHGMYTASELVARGRRKKVLGDTNALVRASYGA